MHLRHLRHLRIGAISAIDRSGSIHIIRHVTISEHDVSTSTTFRLFEIYPILSFLHTTTKQNTMARQFFIGYVVHSYLELR